MLVLVGHVLVKKMSLDVFLKMAKDSTVQIEIGRSFHQLGTFLDNGEIFGAIPILILLKS